MIGGFYIGESYCTSTMTLYFIHALGNKKWILILVVFNLADFYNSSNHQNKFYAKFSVCSIKTVFSYG